MESMVEVRSERVQQSIQRVVIQRTRLKLLFIPVFTSILVWACLVQLWHMRLLSGFTRVTKASVRVDETVHSTTPKFFFADINPFSMGDTSSDVNANNSLKRPDFNSPFYIHPSENAASALLPVVFDGTSYRSWRRAVLRALSVKNKTGFINGKIVKPSFTDPSFMQWERCDDMVTSWILNSLSPDLQDSLQYVNNAKELWEELEDRYDQTNGCKLYQLQKEINDLVQGTLDITGYYTKMKKLWEEMSAIDVHSQCSCVCTCGGKVKLYKTEQDRRLIHFLMGLNEMYTAVRGNILMMSTLPTMAQAFAILSQEERQREMKSPNHMALESTSLNASMLPQSNATNSGSYRGSTGRGNGNYNNTGNFNNTNTYRGNSNIGNRSNMFCEYCKRTGHVKDRCYKLHGYPSNTRNPRGRGKGSAANVHTSEGDGNKCEENFEQGKQMPVNLSKGQYEQLLNLLGNMHGGAESDYLNSVSSGAASLAGNYTSNGFLQVSCNGGLNQMRAAICDMVTVARLLNLTLVVPELDKSSFWADPSNFEDIFDVRHFIDSLRDEVNIIKRLPKKVARSYGYHPVVMPPVSWSSEKYYLQQILPLFSKHQVVNFNRTDTRLANNGIPLELQRLRCQVNFHALKFTQKIEALGQKLVHMLQQRGPFVALHLRYEMDMLAFSGCTEGCTEEEAEELKQLRYAFPWWKEKEIVSDEKRSQGLCPLTPEETTLILQALGIEKNMQIYIASGDIYGSEQRLATLRTAFPKICCERRSPICSGARRFENGELWRRKGDDRESSFFALLLLRDCCQVKKEMLLDPEELQQFQNHSSQMAALDFIVSTASNIFIPTYDGNMAKLIEGHRIMVIRKPSYWIGKLW
ncbi:uncharacterized protein [Solanum lycopersicum]|uniref:uncharacterized protein isoform X3 n=1 Tax=Solanum lycopersicum TaxID=4081 RepID=UPI000E1C5195|nr:uncharacterized protein LOC101257103 isoform X3 [Solanum lycopersicum]